MTLLALLIIYLLIRTNARIGFLQICASVSDQPLEVKCRRVHSKFSLFLLIFSGTFITLMYKSVLIAHLTETKAGIHQDLIRH